MRKLMPTGPEVALANPATAVATSAAGTITMLTMPSPPASDTAAASSGVAAPPMPACWIGTEQPTNLVNVVSNIGFVLLVSLSRSSRPGYHDVRQPARAALGSPGGLFGRRAVAASRSPRPSSCSVSSRPKPVEVPVTSSVLVMNASLATRGRDRYRPRLEDIPSLREQ